MVFDLNGKIALVTGGASGIGLNYTKELLKNGAKGVCLADVSPVFGEKALREIEKLFGANRAIFVQTDVTDMKQFQNAFDKTIETFKHIDILINNAGILNDSCWEKEIAINLNGTIHGILLGLENYLPKYKQGEEALIVNISSIAGLTGFAFIPIYTATKHAIAGLTKSWGTHHFFEKNKVRVIALCPGVTNTPLINEVSGRNLGEDYEEIMKVILPTVPATQQPEYIAMEAMKVLKHAPNGTLWVIESGGNKKASNIIPKEIEQAINFILQHRSEIGIEANNKYVFAIPNPKRIPFFRADDALKQICKNKGLEYSKFNANKLRKHLATCTSTLPKDTQTIISDFMGHTMGVHKEVYQQKQVQTDIVTMGTILMEAGGLETNDKPILTNPPKTLPGTSQDFTPLPESSKLSGSSVKSSGHRKSRNYSNVQSEEMRHVLTPIAEVDESDSPPPTKIHKLSIETDSDSDYCPSSTEYLDDERVKQRKRIFKTLKKSKNPWTTPERMGVRTLFNDYLNKLQVPPIHDIQNIVSSNANISIERKPTSVQSWIAAEIQRRKGNCKQRWSTPERHKVRECFGEHFEAYKNGRHSVRTYPSTFELRKAIDTIPEFKGKSTATLRSKIQHEYRKIEQDLENNRG